MKVLFLTLLAVYSVQAETINDDFSEIIANINVEIQNSVTAFTDFIQNLLEEMAPFFVDVHHIQDELASLSESKPCVKDLNEQMVQLKNETADKMLEHKNNEMVEIFGISQEYETIIKSEKAEVDSFENNFNLCADIECKTEIKAKAEALLERAVAGNKAEDIQDRLRVSVVAIKETILEMTEGYLPRLAEILKAVETCKAEVV